MGFSQNELIQMIKMDKGVISSIVNHLNSTTLVNGYNEGQLVEARLEIDRLEPRILEKASYIDNVFLHEQKIFLKKMKEKLKKY